MNKPMTSNEIESIKTKQNKTNKQKKLPTNKSEGPDSYRDEFYQTKLTPILLKLFQKIAEEGTHTNSFYKHSNTLIPRTKI